MQYMQWIAAWAGFAAVHLTCMAVDWNLRPKGSPMSGGLPEVIVSSIQWGSLGLLLVALFFRMPRSWPKWFKGLAGSLDQGARRTVSILMHGKGPHLELRAFNR